ncbi:hypothetical protein N7481_008008 [Penicillium waksmanii]|uniref:uncharacterized protein n=1 Tax=Penicillium waksmanii TaxID=69791 RepID=UPI0025498B0C|nr:uncharacterized protein N7481_008008 [Penicillium waksmanii]KAJ5980710.1 hypothetical protein N7481_008008 [Penicillium waksmanii]
MVNINVACSTAHYAYLSSGGETMDLVTFIFRHNYAWKHGSSAAPLNKELSRARSHLRLRFARNPVATRRSVHHAALVLAISRDCTSFTPCETMRVFFSFAFLLAFVKFFPFDEGPVATHGASTIRLDESPLEQIRTGDYHGKVGKWIEHGGPASLGSVDNICDAHSLGTLREDALKAMDHLRVWGLAKKFHRVLKSFNND